jgi:hypothetical protein
MMVEKTVGTFYEHISSHMQTLCDLSNMLDLWKWTQKKKPSPNRAKGLDVHFCFNFYTPHPWPSNLGEKCAQYVFKCVKKTFHPTMIPPPPPSFIKINYKLMPTTDRGETTQTNINYAKQWGNLVRVGWVFITKHCQASC